jgi:hypothetical protein
MNKFELLISTQIGASTLNYVNRWTQQLDGLYPLQYFFERGIVSMLLSVHCISLPMQLESNMCNLVNIY